jgi:hypothetical protein
VRCSRLTAVLMAVLLTASLTGCGGSDDAKSQPTAGGTTSSPVTSASASTPTLPPTSSSASMPSARPSATPGRTATKYGDLTLVLNLPAALKPGTESTVLRFQQFHQQFAVMASGQPAPAELTMIADPPAVTYLNEVLAADRKAKQHAGGTLTVTLTELQVGKVLAMVDGCFNQSKLVTIRRDGTRFADATVRKSPAFPVRMTLSRSTGLWKISDYSFHDGKC